jgi:hypothetical protein
VVGASPSLCRCVIRIKGEVIDMRAAVLREMAAHKPWRWGRIGTLR